MTTPDLDPSTVLVVGGGGREHALAWAVARSAGVRRVYAAPGNAGTAGERGVVNVDLADDDLDGLVAFAAERRVGLTVVGPEKPLGAGLVDRFRTAGLPVFGPTRAAARIETSKAWARDFMARHGVPHPRFTVADDLAAAERAVRDLGGRCVVKADGLAAGKGVVVCDTVDDGLAAARGMLVSGVFGMAGARVLVEERMDGPELSVMAISDGDAFTLLPPAQDHKRALDGDQGPNTGGMGAYAPAPLGTPDLVDRIRRTIVEPVLAGMRAEGHPFTGCLYAGLMLTAAGPSVVEFNARFGDPETQVQLPLLESDLAAILRAAATGGGVPDARPRPGHSAACVVVASGGYPGAYATGRSIDGLAEAEAVDGVKVFHAGTRVDPATGAALTAGGRVLDVVCVRPTLADAVAGAYAAIGRPAGGGGPARPGVRFDGMHHRTDIARRALEAPV